VRVGHAPHPDAPNKRSVARDPRRRQARSESAERGLHALYSTGEGGSFTGFITLYIFVMVEYSTSKNVAKIKTKTTKKNININMPTCDYPIIFFNFEYLNYVQRGTHFNFIKIRFVSFFIELSSNVSVC